MIVAAVLVSAGQGQRGQHDDTRLERSHAVHAVRDARDRALIDIDRAGRVGEADASADDLQHRLAGILVLGQLAALRETDRRHAQLLMVEVDTLRRAPLWVVGGLGDQRVGQRGQVQGDRIHARHLTLVAMTPALAPFIDAVELDRLLAADPSIVIVDSRWYLDGRSSADAHAAAHLVGAVFVDLDRWLAAAPSPADGRHPLPAPEVFARGMAAAGIGDDSTVVVYDDAGGVIAARLVWMLRALGLEAAVLDGGLEAWQRAHPGHELEAGAVDVRAASFTARPWPRELLATIDETQAAAHDGTALVLDARTLDRYRGESEPVDARAGHIPGAAHFSCRDNVAADGTLLDTATVRDRLVALGADERPVISYCGSGVTACHTLLVLEHAGFAPGRLYPGSWSQYAADPSRPAATAN